MQEQIQLVGQELLKRQMSPMARGEECFQKLLLRQRSLTERGDARCSKTDADLPGNTNAAAVEKERRP